MVDMLAGVPEAIYAIAKKKYLDYKNDNLPDYQIVSDDMPDMGGEATVHCTNAPQLCPSTYNKITLVFNDAFYKKNKKHNYPLILDFTQKDVSAGYIDTSSCKKHGDDWSCDYYVTKNINAIQIVLNSSENTYISQSAIPIQIGKTYTVHLSYKDGNTWTCAKYPGFTKTKDICYKIT